MYDKERKNANHFILQLVPLIITIPMGFAFYQFFASPNYQYWWGNISNGYQGLYFMGAQMVMIYYGSRVLILLSFNTKLLFDILKGGIKPKIFHYDKSNGLGSLGELIILKWLVAIFIILTIFIVLYFGYLNVENTIEVKLLVSIGSLVIPVIAILPLLKALNEISKVQRDRLKIIGPLLNEKLDIIQGAIVKHDYEETDKQVKSFNEIEAIFCVITKMNVFPFNPRALAFVVTVYAFQIGITIYQLVNHVIG
jgi:hypothetical protein